MAESHGSPLCLYAKLRKGTRQALILTGEPALAQGPFAQPGRYEVLVCMAQQPGELLDDSKLSTDRGMLVKGPWSERAEARRAYGGDTGLGL